MLGQMVPMHYNQQHVDAQVGGVRDGDTMTQKTETATISGPQIFQVEFVDHITGIILNNTTVSRVVLHQTMDLNGQGAVNVLLGRGDAPLISVVVTSSGMMKTEIMQTKFLAPYQMVSMVEILEYNTAAETMNVQTSE